MKDLLASLRGTLTSINYYPSRRRLRWGVVVYRYRTSTFLGRWRATREEAAADAVNARLARIEDGGFEWRVPGEIEAQGRASPVAGIPVSLRPRLNFRRGS